MCLPQKGGYVLSHTTMTLRVSIFAFREVGRPPPQKVCTHPHPTLITRHCHKYANKSRNTTQQIMGYINIQLTRTHAEQKWFKYTGTWQLRRRERISVAVKTKAQDVRQSIYAKRSSFVKSPLWGISNFV